MDVVGSRPGIMSSRKSIQYGSNRQSMSGSRRNRVASVLPQYNPDAEAEQVRDRKSKKIWFCSLFRYASCLDICLMTFGILAALVCAVSLPYLLYWHALILHFGIEDERCRTLLANDRNHSKFTPKLPEEIHNWFFRSLEIFCISCLTCSAFVACFAFAAENQITRLRVAYFESLIRKDMAWLDHYVEREFGRHTTHDITLIRTGIGEKFCYLVYVIAVILALTAVAFYVQWKLTLIVLVLGPVASGIGYVSSVAENRKAFHFETSNTNSGIVAEESLANIKTVKAYEGEAKEIQKFEATLRLDFSWKWIMLGAAAAGAAGFFMLLSYAIVFYFGSEVVWLDLQTVSECEQNKDYGLNGPENLFLIFFCILFASLHIFELPILLGQLGNARNVASEVFLTIDWKSRIDNMSVVGICPDSAAIGKIEFEDVHFQYPRKAGQAALHNIQMTIYPGQVIALVGTLGCGKSTVLRLIQRLYDPTGGNVYLDGHNIENLNIRWLRSNIAIVSQEPVLFNKTVEENVRYAKWSATTMEIQQACRSAGIHEDILLLKDGYQTIFTQHGNVLTASQKRQLSFARAYLQKPKILLLDDPVAGCVPEFEQLVLRAISQTRDHSTIVLASTVINQLVQSCDRIYVMDKGTILERGNHDHLMSLDGAYVELKKRSDAGLALDTKFISQLTSYRFAQSLRRMHLRKTRMHDEHRKHGHGHGHGHSSSTSNINETELYVHTLQNSYRVQPNQTLVLRVAGGLQRYNYTRSQIDPRLHFRRTLDKGVSNVQHERGLKRQAVQAVEESSDQLGPESMQNQRESFSLQFDMLPFMMRARRDSTVSGSSIGRPPGGDRRNSIGSAALSIPSDDSLMFWADYEQMLDNLEDVHAVTSWKDLIKLGLLEWKLVLATILSSCLLGCCPPFVGIIYAEIFGTFTKVNQAAAEEATRTYCIYLVALAAGSGILSFVQEMVFSFGGYRMMADLRKKLLTHILNQDQEWFDKPENDISFLCTRLSTDTALLQTILTLGVGIFFECMTTIVLTIVLAFFTIPHAEVVTACCLGLGIVLLVVIYADCWFQKEWEWITDVKTLDDATNIEIDTITNIRTVITLGLESRFLIDFKNEVQKSKTKLHGLNLLRSFLFGLAYGLPFGCFSLLVYIFYYQYIENNNQSRFIEVLKLQELLIYGFIPIATSLALIPSTYVSLGAAYRLNRIFSSKPKSDQTKITPPEKKDFESPPRIELQNVEFQFSNIEYSILRGVSFTAETRQTVAVVGSEGCGKSSIIQLLLRLYEPTSGFIRIDGDEYSQVELKSTRGITSFVEQNPAIFDCTIRENIAYGDNSRHVHDDEIIEAAKLANVHLEIIGLDLSYDTQISSLDTYEESSFGLRQRIVFARAMLRNPKLLLIDEATASIDSESDFVLLQALDNCSVGRTTIISSQRIEPIRNANLIIVLNNGYIIERGTDADLIQEKGYYFNMYLAQREAEGFSTNLDDFEYRKEMADYYGVNGVSEDQNEADNSRRRSSLQYLNYLKTRLAPTLTRRDSSSLSLVQTRYSVDKVASIASNDFEKTVTVFKKQAGGPGNVSGPNIKPKQETSAHVQKPPTHQPPSNTTPKKINPQKKPSVTDSSSSRTKK